MNNKILNISFIIVLLFISTMVMAQANDIYGYYSQESQVASYGNAYSSSPFSPTVSNGLGNNAYNSYNTVINIIDSDLLRMTGSESGFSFFEEPDNWSGTDGTTSGGLTNPTEFTGTGVIPLTFPHYLFAFLFAAYIAFIAIRKKRKTEIK